MSVASANKHYVNTAVRFGVRRTMAEIVVEEARRTGLPISLAFALCEQESGFRNVFGHDPTIYIGAGNVTTPKYRGYLAARRASGNRKMQGVGVCQLTWWETQDAADKAGGCQHSRYNIRTGFNTLAARIRAFGYAKGIERYNGAGPAAVAYSRTVRARADKWHARLS